MNEFNLPSEHPLHDKKIMAIDYGEKFIGLALFHVNRDPYPIPWERIQVKNKEAILAQINSVIDEEFIDIIVCGIPYLLDGKSTSTTRKMEQFSSELRDYLPIPVYTQDETLSSFSAQERMKNSPRYDFKVDYTKIDSESACIILEDFILHQKELLKL